MLTDLTSTDAFHALRLNTAWAAQTPAIRQAAIYRASDYVMAIYAIDDFRTDLRVIMAVQMLAAEMVAKPLSVAAPSQALLSEEEGLGNGALVEKRTYAAPSSDPYPLVTAILAPIPKRTAVQAQTPSLRTVRLSRD